MFEGISSGLKNALSFIDRGRLTETNVRDGMRQVRQALLEADVNYEVATDFIKTVTEQSVGDKVLKALKPSEHIIGIVNQELINLMGPVDHSLGLKRDGITIIMMCGLQGSGKTTTCGKLARMLKNDLGRKPMMVAADLQRPAAIEQLKVIGEQVNVPVYTEDPSKSSPVTVCKNGLKAAKAQGCDLLILDTAGRLHIDDELMGELKTIDNKLHPDQAILVCDAMTGQDAVNSAKVFNDSLELDGVILTKLDGDTRGGAALSVKAVTGVPIKFIGVGEQLDRLEEFHPERMASRILGGGDLATLMEKAQREFDAADMEEQQEKMAAGKFTLDDFRKQMGQIKKMGSLKDIMKMIPGMGSMIDDNPDIDAEGDMKRIEGIIDSMTLDERTHPDKIDRSRRNRIARGCGCDPAEVNRMLKDFQQMAGLMSKMAGMGMRDRMKAMRELTSGEMMNPDSNVRREKQRSKRGIQDVVKARDKKKQARKKASKAKKRNRRK